MLPVLSGIEQPRQAGQKRALFEGKGQSTLQVRAGESLAAAGDLSGSQQERIAENRQSALEKRQRRLSGGQSLATAGDLSGSQQERIAENRQFALEKRQRRLSEVSSTSVAVDRSPVQNG